MATAKKAAPAKTSKKTAAPAADEDDDLLSTKAKGKKAAAADEGDDDLLTTKKGAKAAPAKKAAAAPAKKAAKAKATEGGVEEVRAVLLKTRKLTSYSDIAEANNFDIRMVRRTARQMRDDDQVELQKEGTLVYVKVKR